ncbi:16S rRNA (guanine(966)-N(2))-methyltransferase RsmD [filamentous cyanobacterium LEGE 11480]|uniref:16S rRNA (Guanine(966)-N(2))-methyltransferase RsmD n=1 Tax=Romeriopsis navalis LEGE 11480 TaxID=2777977 RepID=A0A928VHF5_9CYAN|nr:16S rRNA (guanine(966)-N(2))-methyltransferase RsmD [Romeriopsis navalis]MBE9028395.1 16S rRNA (guanine(966)-N(2))-methyltransferase RsmD [Romeriopsis navalis LEGE 11480]
MALRIYGNRQLKTLPGDVTRPTLAKVREAVFNIWQGTIEDCRWLDLCAGSGAMGAEALCRGAASATAIEQLAPACAVIQANWNQVAKPKQQHGILRGDVLKQLNRLRGQQFDRIYFDPPYASDLYEPVLRSILHYNLLAENGEIAVEHSPHRWDLQPQGLEVCREKRYGIAALTFYRLA